MFAEISQLRRRPQLILGPSPYLKRLLALSLLVCFKLKPVLDVGVGADLQVGAEAGHQLGQHEAVAHRA